MDAVQPVAHLELEEACAAADDGVGAVVQQCKGGVVAVAAYQYVFRRVSGMVSGGALMQVLLHRRRPAGSSMPAPEAAQRRACPGGPLGG